MDKLVGTLLILFGIGLGVYAYITPDFEYGTRFFLQMGICIAGSILIFWKDFVSLFSRKEGDHTVSDITDDHESHDCNKDDICEYCVKDFQCLSYLKARAKEIQSQEALDLVIKLNTLLFSGKDAKNK